MTIRQQASDVEVDHQKFVFSKRARVFPIIDARPLRWPCTSSEADELIEFWRSRAGQALARERLSKKTMALVASHTSRKNGKCPLSDRAISSRTDRSIPSIKRDICRLKKMGFLIAEILLEDGYRKRRRLLQLAVPDVIDEDQRIPSDGDQRIPRADNTHWGSTYGGYVDPTDKGVRRDD